MSRYIILSEKEWHIDLINNLRTIYYNDDWILISNKTEFILDELVKISPHKIFIPHWSYIIPSSIYSKYDCIVFHMTDLPYGRGGSPLQNLIIRGHKTTKISALKVSGGVDTGEIYIKKSLSLDGTAKDILILAALIIKEMIIEIINHNLVPVPQNGEVVEFKRRKPEEGNIINLTNISDIYDYIRMLDCDGYPKAFIETDSIKLEFSNANLLSDDNLIANVRIFKK